MNNLSKTDFVKSPEIVDLLFCSVVSGCVPKVSFLLYRMMRSVFSEWAALPPEWCCSFVGWHIELVLVERRQWHLGSRALGCHGSPPSVLGSHSVDYSLFDLLAPGLVYLCPWFGDTVIEWEYTLFLLHPQFGSNSPCSPSPCGPGALCEVVIGSDEWTII